MLVNKINQFFTRKVVLAIFILTLSLLFIVGAYRYGSFLTFLLIFPHVTDQLSSNLGLNIWLARLISLFITFLLVYVIILIFARGKEAEAKRKTGLLILATMFATYCLLLFFITKDYSFNKIGKSTKCVARNHLGQLEEVSCDWLIHPLYGTEVIPKNKEQNYEYLNQNNSIPDVERIIPHANMRFFTHDRVPLYWYAKRSNGRIEIFKRPGYHPQTSAILKPLTSNIVDELLSQCRRRDNFSGLMQADLTQLRSSLSSIQ